jgi:hypothetical protein
MNNDKRGERGMIQITNLFLIKMNRQELVQLASKLMSRNENNLLEEAIDAINLYILDEEPDQIPGIAYDWISPYLQSYMVGLMKLILTNQDTTEYLEHPIISIRFRDLPEFRKWLVIRKQQLPVIEREPRQTSQLQEPIEQEIYKRRLNRSKIQYDQWNANLRKI